MRMNRLRGVVLPGLVLAGCGLLAACGANGVGGVGTGASSSPNSTGSYSGTPGTLQPLPTTSLGMSTPTATSSAIAPSGAVRLVVNQAAYVAGSSVIVSIENGLSEKILVTNHHTDCTYVELQELVNGSWQPVALCQSLSPVVLMELAPGSVTTQRISIPGAGTYRVMLKYNTGTAFSSTFSVS